MNRDVLQAQLTGPARPSRNPAHRRARIHRFVGENYHRPPIRVVRAFHSANDAAETGVKSHSHSHSHSHEHPPAEARPHEHEHEHEHDHHHDHVHEHNHDHAHDHGRPHDDTKGTTAHEHHHDHDHGHGHSHAQGTPLRSHMKAWVAGSRNTILERGAMKGRILFLDASTAGIAGDMTVAAFLDLGVPMEAIQEGLSALDLHGYDLQAVAASPSGIVAPRFVVRETQRQGYRDWAAIRTMINAAAAKEESALTAGAADFALRAFELLARAEAKCHGLPVETVHFHEVGAVDSIVDIVAAAIAADYLAFDAIWVTPLPMGRGIIRGAAHGPLPSPPPATVGVLCQSGIPTFYAGSDGEFVTPTGACLAAALSEGRVAQWPTMALERVSYGAGTKIWPGRPNLLRMVAGRTV